MSGRHYRSLTARMFAEAVRMSITNVVIKEEGKAHNFQCSSRPDSLKPILPCAVYRDTPTANVRIEKPTTSKKMNIPRASSAAFLTINPFSSTLSFFCWLLLAECHIFHLCYLVYLVRWVHDLRFSVATRSDFYQTKTGMNTNFYVLCLIRCLDTLSPSLFQVVQCPKLGCGHVPPSTRQI